MTSAEVEYRDLKLAAVREGSLPLGDARYLLPAERWSYHPGGFFIRYRPRKYTHLRVDIYKPDQIQLRRDATGRIISIASPDGRQLDPDAIDGPSYAAARSDFSVPRVRTPWRSTIRMTARRRMLLRTAATEGTGSAHAEFVTLARADVADLLALRDRFRVAGPPNADRALLEQALHAAVARSRGIERRADIARSSPLAASLRPQRTGDTFRYDLVAVPDEERFAQGGGFGGWGPGGGGGTGGGSRQRMGTTRSPHGTQRGLPGRAPTPPPPPLPPDEPDALDRAQNAMEWFNKAMDFFSAFTDPAGFLGGQPQGQMLGAGMDQAFKASRQIGNSLSGQHDHASSGAGESIVVVRMAHRRSSFGLPGRAPSLGSGWIATRQAPYREFARPRTIAFPQLVAGQVTEAHARAINATIGTTLRMASTLTAVAATRNHLAAAVAAGDAEWEERQAKAMIHLKRAAGVDMVQLALDLEALGAAAGNRPVLMEVESRSARESVVANGWNPAALTVARDLGLTEAEIQDRSRGWRRSIRRGSRGRCRRHWRSCARRSATTDRFCRGCPKCAHRGTERAESVRR